MKNIPKIYFIRHSKIDLPYSSHLEMPYEVLDDLATSRIDPSIVENSQKLFFESASSLPIKEIDFIYYNNSAKQSNRSKKSAELIQSIIKDKYKKIVPIIGHKDIKEVDFSLPKILAKETFLRLGMPSVRTALYNAELDGKNVESIDKLYKRINRILKNLEKHYLNDKTVLLVSHDFFMRVVEVYITKTKNSKKVTLNDLEQTTLNNYFKGFGVLYNLDSFERF